MASKFNHYCGNSVVFKPEGFLRIHLTGPREGIPGARHQGRENGVLPGCRPVRLPALRPSGKRSWMN